MLYDHGETTAKPIATSFLRDVTYVLSFDLNTSVFTYRSLLLFGYFGDTDLIILP